jgi:hypothetical protein
MDSQPFGPQRGIQIDSTTGEPIGGGGSSASAYLGAAGLLGGTIMDYIGQRQGARSMQAETERQLAEEQAFNARRRQLLQGEIARRDPQRSTALASGALIRATRASRPAVAAGGKALGLPQGAVTSVNRTMEPAQRVGAYRTAGNMLSEQDRQAMARLGLATSAIDDEQELQRSLYDQRTGVAGQKGGAWRMGGQMLQGGGAAAIGGAMGAPR